MENGNGKKNAGRGKIICAMLAGFLTILSAAQVEDMVLYETADYIGWIVALFVVFIFLYLVFRFISAVCRFFTRPMGENRKERAISTDGIDGMTGVEFEKWCARLLQYIGAKNITTTKGSGDQGVDIIADMNGVRYAIQCKCYSKPLGNKPIQEVYAGMQYYHCLAGAVMTNKTFTSGGKALAQSTGVELWDRQWLENAANQTAVKIEEPEVKRTKKAYIYTDEGEKKMEDGKWPHQYSKEIDLDYFLPIRRRPHPDFDVTGRARFPAVDPWTINPDSIITVETDPFDRKEDAELFAEYAEGHFVSKVRVENEKGKYIVVIQTHARSIQANYRDETDTFDL